MVQTTNSESQSSSGWSVAIFVAVVDDGGAISRGWGRRGVSVAGAGWILVVSPAD